MLRFTDGRVRMHGAFVAPGGAGCRMMRSDPLSKFSSPGQPRGNPKAGVDERTGLGLRLHSAGFTKDEISLPLLGRSLPESREPAIVEI